MCYQTDIGCSLLDAKVECPVGYPFFGSNVEVSRCTCPPPSWLLRLVKHDALSCLQESFKVKFEANPKYVEEFIQINVTATRCEKHHCFKCLHRVSAR